MSFLLLSVLTLLGFSGALLLGIVRLKRSEGWYKLIAQTPSDFVGFHSPEGVYLWASPSVEQILGYTPNEMVGRSVYDFFPPEDRTQIRESFELALKGGLARTISRASRKDGSRVWLETLTTSTKSPAGKALRLTSRDVTVRKEMEEMEDLYRFLIRNIPRTSVFLFDRNYRHFIAEGTLVHRTIPPGFQIENRTLWEVFPEDIASALAPFYKEVFRGGVRSTIENFRRRTYECHFLPFRDARGGVKAGLAIFNDVTEERQQVLDLIDRTADLERSNRDLEQFAHVASHELKSPLRRIASFADLLADEISRPSEIQEYVRHIVEGAESLNEVIDSLLTYSRVQTDRSNFTPVDANEIFDEAMSHIAPLVRETRAVVTKGQLPERLVADPVLLRQLFENLVGNGIKFNTSGRRPEVVVTAQRDLLDWVFSIQDNGDGLDPSLESKVFVMFGRLRPDVDGTGIGLALCKKIVGIHRGKIWFDRPPKGPGTVFRFTLPAHSSRTLSPDP
jgi:PAS domain S-box-containing protein